MFTALLSISFYSLLDSLRKLSKKQSSKKQKKTITPIKAKTLHISFNSKYLTPKKKILFQSKNDEENKPFITKSKNSKNSQNLSISKLLGETQIIELVEYKTKIQSDFKEIFNMLKNPQLQLLLLVVTLENITPEISCIFFYYFIEILKFSFFDVNSVFVFASLGFLISLTILNFEFIESSFENFYKVTSFLLSIAYFLNLR
jgi:Na+/melibiose symporter-like transporter